MDGLTPTAARGLRRMVQRALNRGHRARRAVEADLAFCGDSTKLDPAEASVLAALMTWARRGAAWQGGKQSLVAAWEAAGATPPRSPRGPMTATQAALRRLGWQVHGPFHWSDAHGDLVPLTDQKRLQDVIHRGFFPQRRVESCRSAPRGCWRVRIWRRRGDLRA